jgi:uncharacterized membrane protein YgcG
MHRVNRVTQEDDCKVSFATKIWGKTKEFQADIETQRPDERIKWRVSQGITHTGVVTFHELAPRLTRIELNMDVDPGSLIEKAARGMRHVKRAVRADLHRFKAFIEMQEQETGAWRGVIEDGEVVEEHDPAYDEEREYSDIEDMKDDEESQDEDEQDEDEQEEQDEDRSGAQRTRSRSAQSRRPSDSRSSGSGSRSSGSRSRSRGAANGSSRSSSSGSGSGSGGRKSSRTAAASRSSSSRTASSSSKPKSKSSSSGSSSKSRSSKSPKSGGSSSSDAKSTSRSSKSSSGGRRKASSRS